MHAESTVATRPTAAAPAANPQAPRFEIYAPIHKAVRFFMTDTLQRVGCVDAGDDADVRDAVGQTLALMTALSSHLAHENEFIHPAMEARAPGSAARTGGDHGEHVASIEAIENEARALLGAPLAQRGMLALRLYRHLALFVAENLQHMHIEETANTHVLWACWSDAELQDIENALLATIPPEEMASWLHWMAPALSHAELAGMLAGARAQMPPEAFDGMLGLMSSRLTPARSAKLLAALGLGGAAPQPAQA